MKPTPRVHRARGFALVVTLSLLVLLTVIAIGLLSLSAISLRASGQHNEMQAARANAKLALSMAIAQLQKNVGPDTRITAPANLIDDKHPQGLTGTWESWKPASDGSDSHASKKQSNFLGYLISDPDPSSAADPSDLPSGSESQSLVGEGTLGSNAAADQEIEAPLIFSTDAQGRRNGALAWAALEEGVKGRIDLLPEENEPRSVGEAVSRMGTPTRNRAEMLEDMEFLDLKNAELRETMPKLVSLGESDLMASKRNVLGRYFHDFSVSSTTLQTDVANGGLKTDLSVVFDANTLPTTYRNKYLYSNSTSRMATSDPIWDLYANYSKLYRRTTANDNVNAGLRAQTPRNYALSSVLDTTLRSVRYEPNMRTVTEPVLMPNVVRIDTVFTLIARDVHAGRAADLRARGYPYMLHLMYLPVITLHNPFNVPLRFTEIQIEFADLPIGFEFLINGQSATTSPATLNQLYIGNEGGTAKKTFKLTLTGGLNAATEVVMGPGETRIFGKPFPSDWTWSNDLAGDGNLMFDWRNDKTGAGNRIAPGMITGPNDGVGYDVDWVAPRNLRAPWINSRSTEGIIPLRGDDTIAVRYRPMPPSTAGNKFELIMNMAGTKISHSQVFYLNQNNLKTILEEGTSPRFQEPRSFPETFPKSPAEASINTLSIYEGNGTAVKDYVKARPFAIFSLSGKTTQESFTKSRPVADTGVGMQMVTCDFTTSTSQGSSPLEFVLTPVRNGSAVIESDGVKGFFFGGHGSTRGTTSATIYELPMAPLQSIAQLRHANAASLGTAPYVTYTVGESRAHPAIPQGNTRHAVNSSRVLLDHSWLANDRLWDSYWFSTLSTLEGPGYSGSTSMDQDELAEAFFSGDRLLPNPRLFPYLGAGVSAQTVAAEATDPNQAASAANILTKGGFNVNSVSVPAWISVLSGLMEESVPLANGMLETTGKNEVPVLRTRRPSIGLNQNYPIKDELWNAYRTLSHDEIEELAEKIVEEVRLRGPFLSMSDFVNRRLSGGSDFTTKGALQAAIDKTTVNEAMEINSFPVSPGDVNGYGWNNSNAVDGTTAAGAPGEISQGDLLSSIGSFVTVRSDTFKIRAYGDARDANGNILARAWCEATVQRLPEYVDPTDDPEVLPTADANMTFGRRFVVISFRWLNREEV